MHIKFVLAVCIRFFENYFQFIVVSLYCEFVRLHSVRWNVLVFFLFFSFLKVPGPFNFGFDCVLKISKTFNYFFFVPITMGIVFIWGFSLNSLVIINGFLSVRVQNTSMYIFCRKWPRSFEGYSVCPVVTHWLTGRRYRQRPPPSSRLMSNVDRCLNS